MTYAFGMPCAKYKLDKNITLSLYILFKRKKHEKY